MVLSHPCIRCLLTFLIRQYLQLLSNSTVKVKMRFSQPLALGVAALASTTLATPTGDGLPYAPGVEHHHKKPPPPVVNHHIPPFDECFNFRYDPKTTDATLFNETVIECTMQQLCNFCQHEEIGLESAECSHFISIWIAGTTLPWYCGPQKPPALAEVAPEPSHVVPRSSLDYSIDPFVICIGSYSENDSYTFNESLSHCAETEFCEFCKNQDGTDADANMCQLYSDAWLQNRGSVLPCAEPTT